MQRCAPLLSELTGPNKCLKAIFAGPTLNLLQGEAIPAFRMLFEEEERLGQLVMSPKPVFHFSREGLYKLLGTADFPCSVHFAYTNDSSNLESLTACCGVWDEAGQKENKEESYEAFTRRLTIAKGAGFGRRLWGTTPYEWNWFKRRIVDPAIANLHGMEFVNWPSWMNPNVSEENCREELAKGMALWRWEMMYLGRFTRPAGLIFDCFDFELNTTAPIVLDPGQWKIRPCADFGNVNFAGGWIAESPDSPVFYALGEYHAAENRTVGE